MLNLSNSSKTLAILFGTRTYSPICVEEAKLIKHVIHTKGCNVCPKEVIISHSTIQTILFEIIELWRP